MSLGVVAVLRLSGSIYEDLRLRHELNRRVVESVLASDLMMRLLRGREVDLRLDYLLQLLLMTLMRELAIVVGLLRVLREEYLSYFLLMIH